MMKNKDLNALEALDVSVLLRAVPFETAFNCVAELIKYAFYAVSEELEESQSISLDCHYSLTEEYQTIMKGFDSLCSTLTKLQIALLQGIGLPCVIKEDARIDIKPLLLLLLYDKSLEIIDVCLEYVSEGINILTECNQDIGKLEELRNIFVTIREESEKNIKEELPF